eukprot:5171938-Amphidinium_carterae.1
MFDNARAGRRGFTSIRGGLYRPEALERHRIKHLEGMYSHQHGLQPRHHAGCCHRTKVPTLDALRYLSTHLEPS